MYYIKTLKNCCVICKKSTAKTNSSVWKTKQNRSMLVSNCSVCGKKKSRFIKSQWIIGGKFVTKTPLPNIPND